MNQNNIVFDSITGISISDINKDFDNRLYASAITFRKMASKKLSESDCSHWKTINVKNSILKSVLERSPFENAEEILQFNIAITETACEMIIESDLPLIEKIGIYAFIVEIGAREFISSNDVDKTYRNLTAAKENGYFFTPPSLAVRMVITSIAHQPEAKLILDPDTGVGVFLAYHILLNKSVNRVIGIELDAQTAFFAEKLLNYVSEHTNKSVQIDIRCMNFFDYFDDNKDELYADLIIMNPPYGSVKVLSSDLTDISTKANLPQKELAFLENKLKSKTIKKAAKLREQFAAYGTGTGTLEYSKLFMAATLNMLSKTGVLVAITPSSWLGDETSAAFRSNIVSNGHIRELWMIPEKAKMFKGVNQPTTVSIMGIQPSPDITLYNPILQVEDLEHEPTILDLQTIIQVSSSKLKFPLCSKEDLLLLSRLRELGKVRDIVGIINARGELDLTAFKAYVSQKKTSCRLIRGDHIQGSVLVSPSKSEKSGYVLFDSFIDAIRTSEKSRYYKKPRIAIPQCSYLQKKKRIEAAIVPDSVILANSCNFIALSDVDYSFEKLFYYWMILNSSIIEWQFRIFSYNNHVANKEIDDLTCIPFESLSEKYKSRIIDAISRKGRTCAFDCELDALIAKIYGVSLKEYSRILISLNYEKSNLYIQEYVKMTDTIPQHQMPTLSELDKMMISYIEPGGNWTSIPESVPSKRLDQIREMARTRGMVRTTYYSRLRYTQPAYTISTCFNRPGNGANIHPWENRTLSSREAARLQSFPDSFVFDGNEAAVRTQIGNAVPPLLGYAIGLAIKKKVGTALKFCDMFAGAGGLSFGMELAGYDGVVALELNKAAASTYAKNHSKSTRVITGDINDEGIQQELLETIEAGINKETPWVLVGGPPCQGFSTAGHRNENDIRNKLVDSYLRIIKKTQPTIVIME
ncbi:DNA cytosine methyltransferase, partial [Ruminococcus sp.]|uniref:DNA cytosine methyltransferase n=1 Tax=Ruminococcus sp. TaxID=41978 RepID=UPI0025E7D549